MRKMEINEIKAASFQVLCAVAETCEANGIAYSLTGGTLIGAVRHQGFIPWDDDIDVMMPRPDYDRFISIVKNGEYGFDLMCDEICGDDYWYPFAKACHRGTLLVEKNILESNHKLGVYVDIFPVDGAGDNLRLAKLRTSLIQVLHGLRLTANWTKFRRSKLRAWYYEPFRYVCYLLSRMLGRKRVTCWLDKTLRKKKVANSGYAGRLVGDYGAKEVMPSGVFAKYINLPFEGREFSAIAEYDTFLSTLYGNYMELPPKEKRKTHHEFESYWVE